MAYYEKPLTIRVLDMNGAAIFHAIQIGENEWHWTRPEIAGIMLAYRESVITFAINAIAENGYTIEIGKRWYLDAMKGAWDDGTYRTAADLLCRYVL